MEFFTQAWVESLAKKWNADGTLPKIRALINVDMIGDKGLDEMLVRNRSRCTTR